MYIIQCVDVHIGNILVFRGSYWFGLKIRVSVVRIRLRAPLSPLKLSDFGFAVLLRPIMLGPSTQQLNFSG